ARHLLRGAVRGRGIEHASPVLEQRAQHLAQGGGLLAARDLRESRGAAETDDRQVLAGGGNGAGDERPPGAGSAQPPRFERRRGAGGQKQVQVVATRDHGVVLRSNGPYAAAAARCPSPAAARRCCARPSHTASTAHTSASGMAKLATAPRPVARRPSRPSSCAPSTSPPR